MAAQSLQETMEAFGDLDIYVRELFTAKQKKQLDKKRVDWLHKNFRSAEGVEEIIQTSRLASIGQQRASDIGKSESLGFLKAAQKVVRSQQSFEAICQALSAQAKTSSELDDMSDEQRVAFFLFATVVELMAKRRVQYDMVSDKSSALLEPDVRYAFSDWDKNNSPEHMWRTFEFLESMTALLWDRPIVTLSYEEKLPQVLRAGHFYSAVAVQSRRLLR